MEITFKRNKCQSSFDRAGLTSVQGIPDAEVSAMVDKVEIVADNFKYQKCFRRGLCLYFIILVICTLGCIAGHRMRYGRHHSSVRGRYPGSESHFGMGHIPVEPKPMPMPTGRPRPEDRGCWKPRQPVNPEQVKPEETPATPVAPEIPTPREEPALPENAPTQESNPRNLQSMDTASSSQSNPSETVSSPGYPGETVPARPAPWWRRHGDRPWRRSRGHWRWRRHGNRPWRRSRGHWRWRRHGGMRRGPHGRGGRRCFIFKIVFFWVIVPLLMFLGKRCARKRVARRVRQLLEVENRILRAKYGFEWTANWKVTKLTLRRIGAAPQNLGYPTQPAYAMHSERTPFCDAAHQNAPLFTETAPVHHHQQGRTGYQRVSLDDSSIGYDYK